MKAAFVSWQPLAGLDTGYKRRVHCFASHLQGMDVVVVSPPPPVSAPFDHVVVPPVSVPTPPFVSSGLVLGYRLFPGTARVRRALEAISPDVVHSEGVWPFPPVRAYAKGAGVPAVVTVHNIEHLVAMRSRRARFRTLFLRWLETRTYGQADLLVCMSEVDRGYLARAMGVAEERILVVPNGASLPRALPDATAIRSELGIDGPIVLFMGKLDYRPNAEALALLVDRIAPIVKRALPEVVFLVVGAPRPRGLPEGVVATGRVPSVFPYLAAADVCVAPLLSGSGTRLKVLEYMAAGRPVVSTAVGVEGIAVEPGRDVTIAEGSQDFADAIVALLRDRTRASVLAGNARRVVDERYRWEHIAGRYQQHLMLRFGSGR